MSDKIPWPPSLSGTYIRETLSYIVPMLDSPDMDKLSQSSVVSLREVTRETVRIISLLDIGPGQDGLVAPNAFSIAQAHFHPEAWFRAIYADTVPVGFAMLEDWSQVTDHEPALYEGAPYIGLWRFMIDHRFQKRGFGAQALRLLIDHARTRPGVRNMLLSFAPKEHNAEGFYARFGFARTGEMDGTEVVMRLALAQAGEPATWM